MRHRWLGDGVSLPIAPQVFMILSALIAERSGLRYSLEDADLLAAKLSVRTQELGLSSLLDYYYYLRYDDPSGREMDALLDALVVNESYFFRESGALRVIVDHVIVPLAATSRPRVWSAACASGEEPFTLAMFLAQRGVLARVEIIATDVSTIALERARRGELPRRSLREVPEPALAERYLERSGSSVKVNPQIRDAVRFSRVNLIDKSAVRALGEFDVILCRNVLIYFAEDTVRRVVQRMLDQLRLNGILLVGVSESLLRWGGPLQCEEHGGAFLYRKVSA